MKMPTPETETAVKGKLVREDWWPDLLRHYQAMIDAALEAETK